MIAKQSKWNKKKKNQKSDHQTNEGYKLPTEEKKKKTQQTAGKFDTVSIA